MLKKETLLNAFAEMLGQEQEKEEIVRRLANRMEESDFFQEHDVLDYAAFVKLLKFYAEEFFDNEVERAIKNEDTTYMLDLYKKFAAKIVENERDLGEDLLSKVEAVMEAHKKDELELNENEKGVLERFKEVPVLLDEAKKEIEEVRIKDEEGVGFDDLLEGNPGQDSEVAKKLDKILAVLERVESLLHEVSETLERIEERIATRYDVEMVDEEKIESLRATEQEVEAKEKEIEKELSLDVNFDPSKGIDIPIAVDLRDKTSDRLGDNDDNQPVQMTPKIKRKI